MLAFMTIFQIQAISLLSLHIQFKDHIVSFDFVSQKHPVTIYYYYYPMNSWKLLINSFQEHFQIHIIYL